MGGSMRLEPQALRFYRDLYSRTCGEQPMSSQEAERRFRSALDRFFQMAGRIEGRLDAYRPTAQTHAMWRAHFERLFDFGGDCPPGSPAYERALMPSLDIWRAWQAERGEMPLDARRIRAGFEALRTNGLFRYDGRGNALRPSTPLLQADFRSLASVEQLLTRLRYRKTTSLIDGWLNRDEMNAVSSTGTQLFISLYAAPPEGPAVPRHEDLIIAITTPLPQGEGKIVVGIVRDASGRAQSWSWTLTLPRFSMQHPYPDPRYPLVLSGSGHRP